MLGTLSRVCWSLPFSDLRGCQVPKVMGTNCSELLCFICLNPKTSGGSPHRLLRPLPTAQELSVALLVAVICFALPLATTWGHDPYTELPTRDPYTDIHTWDPHGAPCMGSTFRAPHMGSTHRAPPLLLCSLAVSTFFVSKTNKNSLLS